MVVAAKPEIL